MITSAALYRTFNTPWRQYRLASVCSVATPFKPLPLLVPDSGTGDQAEGTENMRLKKKVLKRNQHCLHSNLIPNFAWNVLDTLRKAGYEAYLVGGSVRDLLLHQVPKDFDVLSTAEPREVKRIFRGRAIIVGRRFPVCHVISNKIITEVSSFSTQVKRPKGSESFVSPTSTEVVVNGTEEWDARDYARWENSMKRDFTINGLMYDPFKNELYDYVKGLQDLKSLKVRTVIPAEQSFLEDPARILRGIRIAARLGFSFSRATARAVRSQRFSLLKLNKSRIMSEVNMYFAYGAAEPSLRLLWRYGMLELLLPLQASYFVENGFRRKEAGSSFLLELLRNLDKVVAPDRPCHASLWIALFGFHSATTEAKFDPVVIGAAALTMYHNTDQRKAAEKALRIHTKLHTRCSSLEGQEAELDLTSRGWESVLDEALVLMQNSTECVHRMLDCDLACQTIKTLTGAESKDPIAIPHTVAQRAIALFRRSGRDHNPGQKREVQKVKRSPPSAEAITKGDPEAISYLFSRIVLNALYPPETNKE